MTLTSQLQLQATQKKLKLLEEHYAKRKQELAENQYVRDLSLRSLKRLINQLTEEIARFEAHAKTPK